MDNTTEAVGGGDVPVESERRPAPATAPHNGGAGERRFEVDGDRARPATANGPEGGDHSHESDPGVVLDRATSNGAGEGGDRPRETEEASAYSLVAPHTLQLRRLSRAWMDARKRKQAIKQRWSRENGNGRRWDHMAAEKEHEAVVSIYGRWGREVKKALREHPLWPFLSDLPGLSGPTTAYLIGQIRDPWRFPGQRCENGHYLRPIFDVGEPCPIEEVGEGEMDAGRCGAPTLEPRPGTGVRSLWHYCGLFPGAEKKSGQQASWDPELKGLCLAPDTGLAAQIVRQKPEPYRSTYDEEKERLKRERGYRTNDERVEPVEGRRESDKHNDGPPPLIRLDRIARTIAVKEFVGDLLTTWKDVQPPDEY